MRAPLVVVAAAVVAVTLALSAQEAPCAPPTAPVLQWFGLSTGCTAENGQACAVGETIHFSVTPAGGGFFSGCVMYQWDFGDGVNSTSTAPAHMYPTGDTFFVQVRVSGSGVDVLAGRQVLVIASAVPTIQFFSAGATVVRRGKALVLSWATENATSVRIDPIGVSLASTITSYSFVPDITRTYTLTAFGPAAFRVSSPVTVVVSDVRRRSVRH